MKLIRDWRELEEYAKTDPNPNYYIDFSDGRFEGEGDQEQIHTNIQQKCCKELVLMLN